MAQQQLRKSLVIMAIAMLVMALAVSASRPTRLLEPVSPVTVDQDAGVVRAHGTSKAPMNGCLNVKAAGVNPCGNLTAPAIGGGPAQVATPSSPPPPAAETGY